MYDLGFYTLIYDSKVFYVMDEVKSTLVKLVKPSSVIYI